MSNKVFDINIHSKEEEEEEEEEERKWSSRTPKGHFVVYVGIDKLERFVVPTSFLKDSSFQKLLENAAEEFGFGEAYRDKIVLPCDVSTFKSLVFFLTSYYNSS